MDTITLDGYAEVRGAHPDPDAPAQRDPASARDHFASYPGAVRPVSAERAVGRFLDAVHARDAGAAGGCFTATATYANVPHPPVVGPDGVRGLLAPILERSSRVHWEIVTASYSAERAWLERVDRFVIDGTEYAVACNGVVEVDPGSGLIRAFRDYVDLGVWRATLGDVLDR